MPDWIWTETAAAWAGVVVTAVAGYFALQSWRSSVSAIRSGYRPLVRPIAVRHGGNSSWALILKNYGRGPAIPTIVIDDTGRLMGSVDVIEPLGAREGQDETDRIGRRYLRLERYMENSRTYRVLYQDLGARWHETTFVYSKPPIPADAPKVGVVDVDPMAIDVRYLGTRRSGLWFPQIPRTIATYLAHIASEE